MGIIIPSIPYKSQEDRDAKEERNDCGPTCLAMILFGFGIEASTNAVFRRTGARADGYVSLSQLMRAGQSYGVPFDYFLNWSLDNLKTAVKAGRPVIALVHYGSWVQIDPGVSTQSDFEGPHFVVVVGYDDGHIYVNDPLFWGTRRGEGFRKCWTNAEFKAAWGSNNIDDQKDFSGIISTRSLSTDAWGLPAPEETPTTPEPEELPPPPEPEFYIDPITQFRLSAWAAFHDIPEPRINDPASANAYIEAMGNWGMRVVVHTITENDTLGLIALKYYDDPMKWDVIQKFNGLTPQDSIYDGDILVIPEPLEREVIISEERIPSGGTFEHRTGGINENFDMM